MRKIISDDAKTSLAIQEFCLDGFEIVDRNKDGYLSQGEVKAAPYKDFPMMSGSRKIPASQSKTYAKSMSIIREKMSTSWHGA